MHGKGEQYIPGGVNEALPIVQTLSRHQPTDLISEYTFEFSFVN